MRLQRPSNNCVIDSPVHTNTLQGGIKLDSKKHADAAQCSEIQ